MKRLKTTASAALSEPRLVQLSRNLFAVCLDVMKIIPARHILEQAWQQGLIGKDSLIIESSSGNFALGLAIVCREMGLRLHIVGDPAIDPHLQNMLKNLGVTVDIIATPDHLGSFQRLRLQRIDELLRAHPDAFWVRQYDNPLNPASYEPLAAALADEFGAQFDLVASVGSGGSSVGLARGLRKHGVTGRVTGVDTFNSVLFGLPDGKRTLRGLGNSVVPQILDHRQFDSIHWLSSELGNRAALALHARHGLFCGPTSGAAYWVARHLAAHQDARRTVFIAPDTGYRYQQTVYQDLWRATAQTDAAPERAPAQVGSLGEVGAGGDWSWIEWGRRSMAEVAGLTAQECVQ